MFKPSGYSSHSYGCACGCGTCAPPYGDVSEDMGWSMSYPLNVLIASGTASAKGIPNLPGLPQMYHLSSVSDFLARLPFTVKVTSGFRGWLLNEAVGGAKGSAHMDGRAVDFNPEGYTNRQVAAFIYLNRDKIPDLDQVIWYQDTGHVHVALGGDRKGQFLMGKKEGSDYTSWTPSAQDLATINFLKLKSTWPKTVGMTLLGAAATVVVVAGLRKTKRFRR